MSKKLKPKRPHSDDINFSYATLYDHTTIFFIQEMSGQSIPEKDELKSSSDQIAYAKSWFGVQLLLLFLMLLFSVSLYTNTHI